MQTLEVLIDPEILESMMLYPSSSIKGLYIPTHKLKDIDDYIALANASEINTFVLDVKNDSGYLTFETDNPLLVEFATTSSYLDEVLEVMKENEIYPIARLVTFKDNALAETYPSRMVQDNDGNIYVNASGETWLNPYDTKNWDYILEICKEVIELGFKEIQFDYIRFHESMNDERVDLPDHKSKVEIINEFVDFITEQLQPYNVVISASVFGSIITSNVDAEIVGQNYADLVTKLDAIYPMVYPSHYGEGWYNQDYPDLAPYEIISGAMNDSNKIIEQLDEPHAIVMPWLQDFTATWLVNHQPYEAEQIRQQIDAVYDAQLSGWILWNSAANYTIEALLNDDYATENQS
ncbi:MAG: hypothetical protein ATN34_05290 [Epulopiscium sp. Nele67-Bin002]|nr:MAG: hypothetical protein ATN34_05290 [Epulopiscium sp. Nele67-Bin002]